MTARTSGDPNEGFHVDRYPRNGSVRVRENAFSRAPKIGRGELARWRTKLWVAGVIAFSLIPGAVRGSEVLEQTFDGIVAPRLWVQVVPQVDGVISRILGSKLINSSTLTMRS